MLTNKFPKLFYQAVLNGCVNMV